MSDVDVAAMLAALSSSNLPKEQLASGRSALESKKAESQTSKRKEMQDFSMFPLYLTSSVWDQIQSPSVDSISALDAVLDYLGMPALPFRRHTGVFECHPGEQARTYSSAAAKDYIQPQSFILDGDVQGAGEDG